MSEEPPPGSSERLEAQLSGNNAQRPKPFWRRTPFLMAAPPLTLVMIVAIVGCVSASSTNSPASSRPAAAAAGSPSANAAGSPSDAAGSPVRQVPRPPPTPP